MIPFDQSAPPNPSSLRAEERLRALPGLRLTAQRREVLAVLLDSRDHPGAIEIHQRASGRLDNLSLATVYNCLDTLVDHGAIRQVTGDRHNARYCANLVEHAHFYCTGCGQVFDLMPRANAEPAATLWPLPEGARADGVDVSIHGTCPSCTAK